MIPWYTSPLCLSPARTDCTDSWSPTKQVYGTILEAVGWQWKNSTVIEHHAKVQLYSRNVGKLNKMQSWAKRACSDKVIGLPTVQALTSFNPEESLVWCYFCLFQLHWFVLCRLRRGQNRVSRLDWGTDRWVKLILWQDVFQLLTSLRKAFADLNGKGIERVKIGRLISAG